MDDLLRSFEKAVVSEAGWDGPPSFYLVGGTEREPTFRRFIEFEGHPCDVLTDTWREGTRVDEGTFGLAMTVTGARHLRIDEVRDRLPDTYNQFVAMASADTEDPETIETAVQNAWHDVIDSVSASAMPVQMRVEVRNSVVVLATKWTLMIVCDQGEDPEVLDPIPPKRLTLSRVPHFMWMFLTGTEPVD